MFLITGFAPMLAILTTIEMASDFCYNMEMSEAIKLALTSRRII
jgi:hypothetical protein